MVETTGWAERSNLCPEGEEKWKAISRISTALSGWFIDGKQMGAVNEVLKYAPLDALLKCAEVCEKAKRGRPRKESL